ncbi:hypothetical protein [Actinoplanes sp. DH11]|uniref:hypothetical protein n=1 Tax=Actinoplanes sp. DH11 TaxID=2857011 RepID=UPI001E3FCFF9|nr:hypothetical protein [Actinoplanes sp. DH11]
MSNDAPYGLNRPTADDARAAVLRVHGDNGPQIWEQLVRAAGSDTSLDRLLPAMAAADPTTRLCALALRIRVTTHTELAAAQLTIARS